MPKLENLSLDKRPLYLIVLSRYSHLLWVMATLITFYIIAYEIDFVGLSVPGRHTLAIFVLCLLFWVSNVIPLAVTSLMALALLPLMGVMSTNEAFALFGNPAVFFVLGAFILAAAVMRTGLSTRVALTMLRHFDRDPHHLVTGILVSSAFMSCLMPEHAVAALLFPVILEVVRALELRPYQSEYAKMLFFALVWGAVIGGVATFLGGGRNPLAIGMLKEHTNTTISFMEWILAVFPAVLAILGIAYLVLVNYFEIDIADISKARVVLEKKLFHIGRITVDEIKVIFVMVTTIGSWIFFSDRFGMANIAMLSVVLLFIIRVINWRDVEEYVNWGIILMYGGAIALATAMTKTDAGMWLVNRLLADTGLPPLVLLGIILIIANLLTEGISNAAVVALILPLGFSIGEQYGINPKVIVYMVALPAGLAFCLPMGSPPNAICFASGYYRLRDAIWPGFLMNVASWIVLLLTAKYYWPLIGLNILQ